MIFLVILGAVFLIAGMLMRNASYEYIGIGTWIAGIVYFAFKDHKETIALISGLIILHSGIILLLIDDLSNQEMLGLIVFTAGVIVVLNSGSSMHRK